MLLIEYVNHTLQWRWAEHLENVFLHAKIICIMNSANQGYLKRIDARLLRPEDLKMNADFFVKLGTKKRYWR